MSSELFKIAYHFSLLDDIILFGKINDTYFICIITKIPKNIKNLNYSQSEAHIYIKNNDDSHYCIQISLLSEKNIPNRPIKKWVVDILKKYANNIYKNLKNHSEKIIIKEKDNDFIYYLYDIPAYVWCIVTGMIVAEL